MAKEQAQQSKQGRARTRRSAAERKCLSRMAKVLFSKKGLGGIRRKVAALEQKLKGRPGLAAKEDARDAQNIDHMKAFTKHLVKIHSLAVKA